MLSKLKSYLLQLKKGSKENQQKLSFDQQLVWQQTKPKKVPSIRQVKYISSFLSVRERFILSIAALAILVSAGALGFFLYNQYVQPTPANGGTYEEALIGYPIYINPILASTNDVDLDLVQLLFSGLLEYDKDLNLQPSLAESFVISDDQKTYNLVLKDNLTFHDGEELTIDDVIFTYSRIQDPAVNSPLQFSLQDVQIQRIDDRTIQFVLEKPFAGFGSLLTTGILPQHLWANIPPSNMRLAELNVRPIGSGAYMFSKLKKDKQGNIHSFTVERFESFHEKQSYLDSVTLRFFPDFLTAIESLNNNQVEGIAFVPRQLVENITNTNNYQTHHLPLPQYTSVFFNEEQNSVLEDQEVRQALAYGIDRKRLLEDVLDGLGTIVSGPILPGMVGYDETLEGYPYNPVEAQRLLDEDGWEKISAEEYIAFEQEKAQQEQEELAEENAETDEDIAINDTLPDISESIQIDTAGQTIFRKKDDQILRITLTTVDQPENRRAAEIVKNAWQSIGFKVDIEVVPSQVFIDTILPSRSYEALLYGQILSIEPDPFTFWHSSQINHPGLNLANYDNQDVDTLLEEARETTDSSKREENYKQFQAILDEEVPAVFLYSPQYTYIFTKQMKGFDIDRIAVPANRFQNITEWYSKTKRRLK